MGTVDHDLIDEFVAEVRDELRAPESIPRPALFPRAFVEPHTGHADLDSYLAGRLHDESVDAYVSRTTSFSSFEALESAAKRAYLARRVLDFVL